MFISCKKESQAEHGCYDIPVLRTFLPNTDIANKTVDVELRFNDKPKENFTSIVSTAQSLSGTEGIRQYNINGHIKNGVFVYNDNVDYPMITIIMVKNLVDASQEVFAIKLLFNKEGYTWNGSAYAKIGVIESFNTITITSNNLASPFYDWKYVCIKIVIHKNLN